MGREHIAQFVIKWNQSQSEEFNSPRARLLRERYMGQHPTCIIKRLCMDGRVNLATMSNTPPGIMYPFRTMGGVFDAGYPYLSEVYDKLVQDAVRCGHSVLDFCTYHFSGGDNEKRGCRGMGHDITRSREASFGLKRQVEYIYGKGGVVNPIVLGIETDSDAFIFHNGGNATLDMRTCEDFTESQLRYALREVYPEMEDRVLDDLLPFAVGNLKHMQEVKGRPPIEMEHLEQVICVGRGYGWFHLPNVAFIIGPFREVWPSEVVVAGDIIRKNMENWKREGREPKYDGVAVLCSSAFSGQIEKRRAEIRARYFASVATEVLRRKVPELRFRLIIGATDMETQMLEVFEQLQY